MKNTKKALFRSMIALLLCVSMFVGTTFAWFTDEVTSMNNIIQTGILDVELEWLNPLGIWQPVNDQTNVFDENALWEPGHTEVVYLRVSNKGSLALKYQLGINVVSQTLGTNVYGNSFKLSDYIEMGAVKDVSTAYDTREDARGDVTTSGTLSSGYTTTGTMNAGDGEQYIALVVFMPEDVDNVANYKTGTTPPTINLGITLLATQMTAENDSFGPDYDENAQFPVLKPGSITVDVTPDANGYLTADVQMANSDGTLQAVIPAGTKVTGNSLTLSVSEMSASGTNITLQENEVLRSMDVHIDGLAEDNTVPAVITVKEAMMPGLNIGNYALYHVEDGVESVMTADSSLDTHNDFAYDPATGDVTLAMATFSEVALVANTVNAWNGNRDYSWYDASKTDLTIANADQLAAFGAIVGGMAKKNSEGEIYTSTGVDESATVVQDSFSGMTVKLIADINLSDKESENNPDIIFYPIGYNSDDGKYEKTGVAVSTGFYTFEGTFDGNGHTISNFYQNTWEMKGDHNWYDATLQYYRDGMGLFGKVYGGTVKNLTVKNFSSDGEITTTGVIAAYADGATFENIAIFDCNPRVYNIGNGGIVGCVGWYAKDAGLKTTFTNITVDNSNKISALWGSYDVACGGIVGQYYPTSGQSFANGGVHFENCHVSAVMDVYNDVCANYQYYAYRYTGMLIGSIRENETIDGHVYPKMDGITAEGCTVHFGDWNDYYYCELVANTTASYTHDHQMSRLTQVASVDVEKMKVTDLDGKTTDIPTSGRVNYVVVKAKDDNGMWIHGDGHDYAECYHFVNGVQHFHDVADSDNPNPTETVNGVEGVLKEDKQLIYREFNQLFTGYGWGVTSKGLTDYEGVENMDITEGDHEASVEKFEGKVTELANNKEYKLGDIFSFVDKGVKLVPGALTVTVTNLDENQPVSYVFERATATQDNWEEWANGTLKLSGTGTVMITIQDYYFCTPTTITVDVKNAEDITRIDRFTIELPNTAKYLYRVGNLNEVPLNKLFGIVEGKEDNVGNVSVHVETIIGASASDATNVDLDVDTIGFTNTGVVAVTISDDNFSVPKTLYLEVVDAKNITSATGSNGIDVVLLNDVTIASGGTANYTNCTVYGNGFTFDIRGGMNQYNSKQGHGIIITSGATIDNLVVLGDVYDTYGAYTNQEDYTGAFDATNTTFTNCYISNCATPIRANGVTIKDTTLYGGTIANLIISGGTNTLENVTTVNYNDGRGVLGFGIVISDGANENVKLVLNGELRQYNFVCKDDASSVPDDTAKKLFNAMFDSAYSAYHFGTDPVYVNTGILSMVSTFDASDITNNTGNGYTGTAVSYNTGLGTASGYLYALPASGNSVDNGYDAENDAHKATVQGDYLPKFNFDLGNQAISNDGADDTRYLTGDASGVEALYQNNESPITLDLTKLATAHKYTGTSNDISVSYKDANGNILGTDTTVSLTTSGMLVFTVTDNLFYDENGVKLNKSVERIYEVPVTVSVKQAAIPNAELNITNYSLTGTYAAASMLDNSQYLSFNPLEAITVTDYDANGKGTAVDLDANISSTTVEYVNTTIGAWGGATITINYTDNRVLTIVLGATSMNSPGASNGGKTITVTNGTVKSDGKVAKSSATGGTWPITSYSFKGNNGSTVTKNETVTVTFTDVNAGGSGCFAEGTLITLADGTQKPIEEITYADELLAWDFNTGTYVTTVPSLIESHEAGEYRVINLKFADGTIARVIVDHGFFDVAENNFVYIDEENVASYVDHEFVKVGENGTYETVKLVDYEVTVETVSYYTIQTAIYNNCIAENMFTLTSPPEMLDNDGWFDYFEIGEGMKYDEEKMQADIEKYGLYTFEDFAEYVTYEQFIAFNGPYLKVLVGRGVVTYEQIIELIATYVNP